MKNSAVVSTARFAGLLFTGLFSGFLVAVLVLELSLRSFDRYVYTQVRQVELDALDILAGATLIPGAIATLIVVAFAVKVKGRALWLPLTALVLLVVVFILTSAINVPINSDQADWNVEAPPSDWADVRDRWQVSHVVRTILALGAFISLIAAAMTAKSPTSRETTPS